MSFAACCEYSATMRCPPRATASDTASPVSWFAENTGWSRDVSRVPPDCPNRAPAAVRLLACSVRVLELRFVCVACEPSW